MSAEKSGAEPAREDSSVPDTSTEKSRIRPVKEESLVFLPWKVFATTGSILPSRCPTGQCATRCSCAVAQFTAELSSLPQWPEMIFPFNCLRLEYHQGDQVRGGIAFTALPALKMVDCEHGPGVCVAAAGQWKHSRQNQQELTMTVQDYDWTFTTGYKGTLLDHTSSEPTDERINLEKLKQKDKIQFYQDIMLFEDELSDNGLSKLSVKIRVMPTSFFILMRFIVRVDGVLARVHDTRLYHEMGMNYLLREHCIKERRFADDPLPLHVTSDLNVLPEHLSLIHEEFDKLVLNV